MLDPETATLQEAKEWLRKRFSDGANCPCCNQFVKRYKRKLNSSMAHALVLIYKFFEHNKDRWLHVPSYLSTVSSSAAARGGDWSKLRYWGLILPQKGTREDGSERVGNYRITELGKQFITGQAQVRKHVYLYNQEALPYDDGEKTSIREALGTKFNYADLMGSS